MFYSQSQPAYLRKVLPDAQQLLMLIVLIQFQALTLPGFELVLMHQNYFLPLFSPLNAVVDGRLAGAAHFLRLLTCMQ